jgi:ribosomal protein S18 acetylase RimI-like enzyme
MIRYASERVGHEEVFALLVKSGLFNDVTLPIDAARVGAAFDGSNLIITARDEGRLVGVGRALTDFVRHCFLATLAVDPDASGQGIGRALIAHVHEAAGGADKIVLFLNSAPGAVRFYERIGMQPEATFFSRNNVH